MSSTILGLSSRPYLLASAVCRLPLLVNPLSSRRLHDNYTRKPRAPPKSRATCCYPRAAYLPSLVPYRLLHLLAFVCQVLVPYRLLHLLPFVCRLLVRVDHLSSRRLLVDVNHSLYQHLLEIQCAIEHIYNEYGLWTADTWAMSADAQLCDSGQWTQRDRRWQFWPCNPEVWTPHGEE